MLFVFFLKKNHQLGVILVKNRPFTFYHKTVTAFKNLL
jgi:hypothetical protein